MKKQLIFTPKTKGYFKNNPFYALPVFAKTMALCSGYLARCRGSKEAIKKLTDDYMDLFWRANFEESKTRLFVSGAEYLEDGKSYVFMSNHESWMDIPAIVGAANRSLRMVSKIGMSKIPFIGKAMNNAGFIFVDRKNRSKAIKQLEEAKERLKEGISIWIAPEGTRSRDKSIATFKKGGFHVAKALSLPIVPAFIEGAYEVLPPDGIFIRPNRDITVHFCKPIATDANDGTSVDDLVKKVREAIFNKKSEIRGE